MNEAGMTGDVPITIVAGPDSYLFGEEKGLLEVIEGEDPLPRRFPPYIHGLFAGPQMGWSAHAVDVPDDAVEVAGVANPTLVNNVETLASVSQILARSPEWYRSLGTAGSPGTMVFTVVGDVVRPGYAELELGLPLRGTPSWSSACRCARSSRWSVVDPSRGGPSRQSSRACRTPSSPAPTSMPPPATKV
jgi:NADH:ubiquinone oxidoreductase subunit F (NADH-binding)